MNKKIDIRKLTSGFLKYKQKIRFNPKNKKLWIDLKKIALILFCTFLFLFFWVNRVKLYPQNICLWIHDKQHSFGNGSGYPYSTEEEKIFSNNFGFLNNNIFLLSNTSFTVLNKSAKTVYTEKHDLSNPFIKIGGIRAVIYDIGGKNYRIESSSRCLHKASAEKPIISAAIAESGVYGLITQSSNYLSELTVFGTNNKEKYNYRFSEYYATDVAINSQGSNAAVCAISASQGKVCSLVYVLDFKDETPKEKFEFSDNMITKVEYFSNGNILAVGDKYLSIINMKSKKCQNFSYDNKILKLSETNKEDGICCCLSPSLSQADQDEFVFLDTFGKVTSRFQTQENFSDISYRNNSFAGVAHNKILLYGLNGAIQKHADLKHSPKKIMLSKNYSVYTLNSRSVDKIRLS